MNRNSRSASGVAADRLILSAPNVERHPLDGAIARVSRAGEHLQEFEKLATERGRQYLNQIVVESHPELPDQVRVRPFQAPLPSAPIFGVLAGEVLYNLRSALDYLVHELSLVDSGAVQDGTQFPIADDRKRFAERKKSGALKGLNSAHLAAIEGLQPYNGADWLRVLRDLSNPDKHRRLTIAIGSHEVQCSAFGADRRREFETKPGLIHHVETLSGFEVYVHLDVTLLVTFEDGRGVLKTLNCLKAEVSRVIDTFKPDFE